jgi:hypothetical protein
VASEAWPRARLSSVSMSGNANSMEVSIPAGKSPRCFTGSLSATGDLKFHALYHACGAGYYWDANTHRKTPTTFVGTGTDSAGGYFGTVDVSFAVARDSFLTPDVSVVQYISDIKTQPCAAELQHTLHFGHNRAVTVCLTLGSTQNPPPPPRLNSASAYLNFIVSKEYRGFIHLPQMAVSCSKGKVATVDDIPIPATATAVPLNLPDFLWSPGWTPTPVTRTPYEPAEIFTSDASGTGFDTVFDDRSASPQVSVHGGMVVVSFMGASRLATTARAAAYSLTGYEAPFIWSIVQMRFDCAGHESVWVANSEFPTTNLYINGTLHSWYTQTALGGFIKSGEKVIQPPEKGFLALLPTCGERLHWERHKNDLPARDPHGGCGLVVLAGPNGGNKSGNFL